MASRLIYPGHIKGISRIETDEIEVSDRSHHKKTSLKNHNKSGTATTQYQSNIN